MCLGCHVVTLAIEMKNLNAIQAACKRLGWNFKANQNTYRWFGRWVDDSPVPRQLFTEEQEYQRVLAMPKIERQKYMTEKLGKCTHAIEVPGCHYDIGLIQQGDKYVPIWDWFAGGMRQAMGHGQAENPFAQAYGVEMAKLQAQGMGLYSTEQLNNDGSITLRVQLPS